MLFCTLLISALLGLVHSQNGTAACKLAYVFGGEGNSTSYKPNNQTSKFCKSLNLTCCSSNDFMKMYDLWENSSVADNIKTSRTKDMRDLIDLVNFLQKADTDLTAITNEIKKTRIDADPACLTPAHVQGNINKLELINVGLTQFRKTGRTCWDYTKDILNGLMCASCDSDAQTYIDTKTKVLTISNQECSRFITACGEHIKSIHAVYFYYNIYYRLSYCNTEGVFFSNKIPTFMNFNTTTLKAIDGCMKYKNKDDCAGVCSTQFGFSTMVNYQFENKNSLIMFKDSIVNYLKTGGNPNMTNNTKPPQPKRRLLPPAAWAASELASYKVLVMKNGMNFDKYTANNLDGYTNIEMSEVFFGKLLTVASTTIALIIASLAI